MKAQESGTAKKKLIRLSCVIFWLIVWQIAASAVNRPIFFVSPLEAAARLIELMRGVDFWLSLGRTTLKIMCGYAASCAAAVLLAAASDSLPLVRELVSPLMTAVRSVPVVSFTILALILLPSKWLCVLISFLMVFPIVYTGALAAFDSRSGELAEMADAFGVAGARRLRYVDLPQMYGGLEASICAACGFAWKSGVAAEVIGITTGSVGERLQQAKVYLMTPDLFAWTIAVVVMSALCTKAVKIVLSLIKNAALRMPEKRGKASAEGALSPEAPQIAFKGVSKSYGEKKVLSGFDFTAAPGSRTALEGPSGIGKTTLLRLAAGLEEPDSGTVDNGGGKAAAVFQEDRLIPQLSARKNIRLVSPSLSDGEIDAALLAVGLEGEGDRPVAELSGGMKRRAAILRALLFSSGAAFLDEPFKGLDGPLKERVAAYASKRLEGRTVLFVYPRRRRGGDARLRQQGVL